MTCEGDESEAAILTWTPDENTPDVVYYQVRYDIATVRITASCMHIIHCSVLITFILVGGLNSVMSI